MARAEHTVIVERPPDEVFDFLTDFSNVPSWQSGAVDVEKPVGPLAVGVTYVQVLSFLGRRMKTTLEVTEFEQGRRFSLKTVSGPVPFEVRHTLEPENGGGATRLHVRLEGEPRGFFRMAESLVERKAQRQIEHDFATLKELVEARGAPSRSGASGKDPSGIDTS
jgi:carbon monoxide dehydrogenase subunit G